MRRTVSENGPDPVDQFVGGRIAEMRHRLGLTQADLAKALGLTFQQVQKYEKGTNRVSASKLWATAQCLGVGVEYFFAGLPNKGMARGGQPGSPDLMTATRLSVEVEQMTRQLPVQQQRLLLQLVSSMAEAVAPSTANDMTPAVAETMRAKGRSRRKVPIRQGAATSSTGELS